MIGGKRPGLDILEGRWFLRLFLFSVAGLSAAIAISQVSFASRPRFQPPGALQTAFSGFADGDRDNSASSSEAGSAASTPGASGAAEATMVERYFAQVLQKVNRQKRYPLREKEERLEGEAVVRLTVSRDGSLTQADLLQASPHTGFNREAMASVRRAAPFPEFPEEVQRAALTFDVRVYFKLN
jgi:TonB family protein